MLRLTIRHISMICCLLMANQGLANEMSIFKFEVQEKQVSLALSAMTGAESVADLESSLSQFQDEKRIIALERILNLLSQSQTPTDEHRTWVQQYVNHPGVIYTRYPEHPEQKVTFINIANSAKRTLALWDIAEHQRLFAADWQSRSWQWPTELAIDEKQALINWVSTLQNAELEVLVEDFLLNASSALKTDNSILYALAKHSGSPAMYQLLWQQPADQYSYKALSELSTSLSEMGSVKQLISASSKPELSSQALLSLARSYSHTKQAQDFLTKALEKEKLAWHAASAYKFIKSPAFKLEMAKRLANKDDKVSRFANKNLSQGAEQ